MKVRVTPAEFQEKHARRLKASAEDIARGIDKVATAPGVLAQQKQAKMKTKLNEAIDSGLWGRRVSAVSLPDWKDKAKNIGIGRIPAGIDGASKKVTDFASQLLPVVEAVATKVEGMPDVSIEDSVNRASTFIREMAKFKKK